MFKCEAQRKKQQMSVSGDVTAAEISKFPKLVVQLRDQTVNLNKKTIIIRRLRKVLSTESPPIKEVIETAGCLQSLVECLRDDRNTEMQFESAWALTNIASGSSEETEAVVMSGALTCFCNIIMEAKDYIEQSKMDLVDQSVWGIGNIVCDGPTHRDLVLNSQPQLLSTLWELYKQQHLTDSFKDNIVWLTTEFFKGSPAPLIKRVVAGIPLLIHNIMNCTALTDSLWALSHFTKGGSEQTEVVLQHSGIPEKLSDLVTMKVEIATPSLQIICNILTGDEYHINAILKTDILHNFKSFLTHSTDKSTHIIKDCCLGISYVLSGSTQQVQQVIDIGLIPLIVNHIINNKPRGTEAICALRNLLCFGDREQHAVLLPHVKDLVKAFGNMCHDDSTFTDVFLKLSESQREGFFTLIGPHEMMWLQSVFITESEPTYVIKEVRSKLLVNMTSIMTMYEEYQTTIGK